uniref:Uncharacterized protein n=1 Tax=Anguilla anguilla TaxID=7936 RepID=A0A0E9QLI1_ANGAN
MLPKLETLKAKTKRIGYFKRSLLHCLSSHFLSGRGQIALTVS